MEDGWEGAGVMLQQVANVAECGVADDAKSVWRDPYDGEPYSPEERRMIEEGRRSAREEPTHTTKELFDLLGLDEDDDNAEAQSGRTAGAGERATPRQRVTMALVYDFDGTLAPGNMQERQVHSRRWDDAARVLDGGGPPVQRQPGRPDPDVHVLHAAEGG